MATRTVLITGASTGFGYVLARGLREAGERPIASMRDPGGKNAEPARRLADEGIDVIEIDVTSDESVAAGVAEAFRRAGRLDVLVNNAGYGLMGPVEAATIADMKEQYETNVFGSQRMVRAILPHMRERREGLLVHISSGAGRFCLPGGGIYASSKWALEALAESLRYELAPLGIDSTIIEPGPYATDFSTRSLRFASDVERISAYEAVTRGLRNRMRKIKAGDPQEIVGALRRLLDTPRGKRPTRVVLHPAREVIEKLNAAQSDLTSALLAEFAVPELLANGV